MAPIAAAAARGGQQYFVNPALSLDYFALNTHRPLFSDVRHPASRELRNRPARAVRTRETRFRRLPDRSHRPLPAARNAGLPRRQRLPDTTPDLAKARTAGRGRRGRTAVLYTCDSSPCPEQAQIVKTDLAAIGLHVQIKTFPYDDLFHNAGQARPSVRPRLGRLVTRLHRPRGDAELAPRGQLRRPDLRRSGLPAAACRRRRGSPAQSATSPTDGSTSTSPATPRLWPRSTTCPATTSSPRGSAARPTGSTAWTSPHSASGAPTPMIGRPGPTPDRGLVRPSHTDAGHQEPRYSTHGAGSPPSALGGQARIRRRSTLSRGALRQIVIRLQLR